MEEVVLCASKSSPARVRVTNGDARKCELLDNNL